MPAAHGLDYVAALRSLWELVRSQPVLREAAAMGFLVFGSFIAFWTNLAFFLGSPHYRLGAAVTGSFGLLGAAGALVASIAGRLADRYGARATLTLSLLFLTAGWAILLVFGYRISGIIAGVVVLDMGMQANQISNQTRIFALSRAARSRINTVYMIGFFLGGAVGSALSSAAWSRWQWNGVCGWGLAMLGLAWVSHWMGSAGSPLRGRGPVWGTSPAPRE
jgi:predicted MFS family arabinose efflux permease